MFIALGRKDKIDPPKLVKLIQEEAMVDSHLIRNIEIYDNFSFANVPFEEAEHIIEIFRGRGRDKKPLIVEAKGKEKSSPKKNFRSGAPRKIYDRKSGSGKPRRKKRY